MSRRPSVLQEHLYPRTLILSHKQLTASDHGTIRDRFFVTAIHMITQIYPLDTIQMD